MNCKDCCQDCQRIGCDIELECSGYIEPSNGTKERMNERLAMMHKLYPDAKQTNADRIRAMTDEELAKELWAWNQTCCHKWKAEEIAEWLKQEATDGS